MEFFTKKMNQLFHNNPVIVFLKNLKIILLFHMIKSFKKIKD